MSAIDTTLEKMLDSENLSFEEASAAMNEIMNGMVSPVKLSSWLTALRMKGESAQEIAGLALVMREHAKNVSCDDPDAVDIVGTGGDKAQTINVSTAAAFVAAGAGITVAKHGNRAVSSKSGSADVLEALGIKIDIDSSKMEECLNTTGIAFLFAPLMHPAMKHAMPVRRELGIRTVFNILGPLTNPAGVTRFILGVYDRRLCRLMAEASARMDFKKMLAVHGDDGLDEITITAPTYVCEAEKNSINEYIIGPEEFDMDLSHIEDIKGGTPQENANIIRKILKNELNGPKRDIIVVNAAAAIIASGKCDGWNDALKSAQNSINDGSALDKLDKMTEFTNKVSS